MKHLLTTITLIFGFLNSACENDATTRPSGTGILEGKVVIGPLCPVEPCNLPPEQIAALYQARKILIYEKSSLNKVIEFPLNADGGYAVILNPGRYIVDVSDAAGNALPLDLSQRPRIGNTVPQEAEIFSDQTTVSDFDIDSGIR